MMKKRNRGFLLLTLALLSVATTISTGLEETTTTTSVNTGNSNPSESSQPSTLSSPPSNRVDETNIPLASDILPSGQITASSTTGTISKNSSVPDSSAEVVSGDEIKVNPISGESLPELSPESTAAATVTTANSLTNTKILSPTVDEPMKEKSVVSGSAAKISESTTPSLLKLADGNDSSSGSTTVAASEAVTSTSPQPDRSPRLDVSEETAETSTTTSLQLEGEASGVETGGAASSSSSGPSSGKPEDSGSIASNRGHKKILFFQKGNTITTKAPEMDLAFESKTTITPMEGREDVDLFPAAGETASSSTSSSVTTSSSTTSSTSASDGNEILGPSDSTSGSGVSSAPSSSIATSREERKTLLFSKPSTTMGTADAAGEIIPLVSLTSGTHSTTPSPAIRATEPTGSMITGINKDLRMHADVAASESTTGSSSSNSQHVMSTETSGIINVTVSSSSIAQTESQETAVPVISSSTRGGNSSPTSSASLHPTEVKIENESGKESGEESGRQKEQAKEGKTISTGIPNSGRVGEVNASQIGITNYAAASLPPPGPSLDPSLTGGSIEPAVLSREEGPALTSPDAASTTAGNNLSPSDNVAPESPQPPPSSPSSSTQRSPEAVKEGGEGNVNHHGEHHPEGEGTSRETTDDPSAASSFPSSSTDWQIPDEFTQTALSTVQNATSSPSFPVLYPTNHTATQSSNMTDEAEAKCNRENSSSSTSSSSRYNLSGFRFNTFEAFILIFVLVFVICAVFVLLFVFTIFRRKGNHTFDFQASRNQTPTVFQMRGKFLQENRMLRGYDLNSADQILKDEESNFPMNHMNPRVQHLDSYHHYLHHHHPHVGLNVRRGSSGSSSPNHPARFSKHMVDPHAMTGISLKPIYLPRPVANTVPATNNSSHSASPTNDSGRLVSQSMYPYNLARLSPAERNRVFYQKRIPGGANILVNDAWMVLPLDSVRRGSCYSCSSSTRDDRSTCEGCRRHSCPVDPTKEDRTIDRGSSSSRGSRDSHTNNNNRNESDHNQMNNKNQHHAQPNQRKNASTKTSKNINNKYSNEKERPDPVTKSAIVNDVTDTKL